MAIGRTYALINMQRPVQLGDDVFPLRQPAAPLRLGETFTEATFVLGVWGVLGNPTTWKIEARPLIRIPSIGGPGTGGFQHRNGAWAPLDEANMQGMCTERVGFHGPNQDAPVGGDWGVIADHTTHPELKKTNFWDRFTDNVVVQRTFKDFGADMAIELRLTATGGTNPQFAIALDLTAKG